MKRVKGVFFEMCSLVLIFLIHEAGDGDGDGDGDDDDDDDDGGGGGGDDDDDDDDDDDADDDIGMLSFLPSHFFEETCPKDSIFLKDIDISGPFKGCQIDGTGCHLATP